jgi:hypothetical protein
MAFKGDIGVIGFGGTGVKGLALEGPGVHGVGSDGPGGAATNRGVMGPGVLGHGGRSTGLTGVRLIHAAGVIGVAGDTTPQSSETNETGVYGTGHDGVRGAGTDGRGGIFQSARTAQVQLVPTVKSVGRERSAFTPVTVSNAETAGPELPRNGRAGDLMCVLDQDGQCSLWFCVRSPSSGVTAQWAQVLLGPQFNGRG